MIDYETYCRIKDALQRQRLNYAQAAQALGLHRQTVAAWGRREQYRARAQPRRASRLDPFKRQIVAWLEAHRYSAMQIVQRLRSSGYQGGVTIVRDYVRQVRPPAREAFLTLSFAPGEAAQVDWGEYLVRMQPLLINELGTRIEARHGSSFQSALEGIDRERKELVRTYLDATEEALSNLDSLARAIRGWKAVIDVIGVVSIQP